MSTFHPEKPAVAPDGSVRWSITPQRHSQEGHASIYGALKATVLVYESQASYGDHVKLKFDALCSELNVSLSPDEARALGAALILAGTQAQENAAEREFLDDLHEALHSHDGARSGCIVMHPKVHYCHPDDFAQQSKQLPVGHTLITDELCPRASAEAA